MYLDKEDQRKQSFK